MQEGGALSVESSSPHALTDSAQSPHYLGPSPGKSKKRERPDQNATAPKKDQLNEEYRSPPKRECMGKFDGEDGGLLNIYAVDQLIVRMKQEQASSQRSKLVGVVVATTKEDCLQKFVQMGGVSILEEWIQDRFKSRSSDVNLKDSDKSVDGEMLMILQALEKLPIDLDALKGCSIGKAVKGLRSVQNVELQRKARKLIDTWKKRVDFEMNQSTGGGHECNVHVDLISRSSDLSPARGVEGSVLETLPYESMTPLQEVDETTLASTPLNTSTSDASPKAPGKSSISSEKDASRGTTHLCSVSAPTLSSPKRKKHSSALATDKDCKEELPNVTGTQKVKEKDPKCENSIAKSDPTGNAASNPWKANEYRKKLRSGSSSAAACSTDLHASVSPSNAVQTRVISDEKNMCTDGNTGDSEQVSKKSVATKAMNTIDGNRALDPPDPRSIKPGCKEEILTEKYPQDEKTDHVNESCLSSQSSCTNKQTDNTPGVTFETTKMCSHTSQLQGDSKLNPLLHLLDSSSGGSLHPSMKSMSSEDHCSDEGIHKSSTLDPELKHSNTSMDVVLLKRSELTDTQQGGAMEGEESCCSYDNVAEKSQRESAEHPSSYATLQKDGRLFDGGANTVSRKANMNICQEPEKEKLAKIDVKVNEAPATTHSCHEFDLNEGLAMDEFLLQDSRPVCVPHATSTSSALSGLVKASTSTLSSPVAVSPASKGAFVPPLNSIYKCDSGWTGSAATSAFHPAEPRHVPAKVQSSLLSDEVRNVNCFDLNVADQGSYEDCLPASAMQRNQEAHLDLNCDGKDVETEISTSISESTMHFSLGGVQKLPEKRPARDFDLNEQVDEVWQEEKVLATPAAGRVNGVLCFGGPSGRALPGDVPAWHSEGSTPFPIMVSANGVRTEQLFAGSNSQKTASTTGSLTPFSSVVYSQTPPFFGGMQIPFQANFSCSPVSAGADLPSPNMSIVGRRSRPETSLVRPTFVTGMDDLRGGNSFYTWGRPYQNMYGGSSGPTIIGYNDAIVGGREHIVNFDRTAVLEEPMRLYQQAAVPLRRKEPEYFSGLKQTTWH